MLSFDISDADTSATVTVEYIGTTFESGAAYRAYAYSIITPEWRFDGNDIRSGCNADVDESDAARTLFSFLSACAESRTYGDGSGWSENASLFPNHVGAWAEYHSDELSMLSMDPADFQDDDEAMQNRIADHEQALMTSAYDHMFGE